MTSQPRLSQIPLWQRHVETVLETFREALALLSSDSVVGQEPDLNRELYDRLQMADRNRFNRNLRTLIAPIMYEARNPPSPDTKGTSSERKIPDFQCGYIDHQEPDPLRAARFFMIECKRLGHSSKSGWAFNSNYIHEGVMRFVDRNWRYGKDVADGAMVGYIESMTLEELMTEVNRVATSLHLPALESFSGGEKPLHELRHKLTRLFPISPFILWHLWIEMKVSSDTDEPTPAEP